MSTLAVLTYPNVLVRHTLFFTQTKQFIVDNGMLSDLRDDHLWKSYLYRRAFVLQYNGFAFSFWDRIVPVGCDRTLASIRNMAAVEGWKRLAWSRGLLYHAVLASSPLVDDVTLAPVSEAEIERLLVMRYPIFRGF